MYKNESTEPYFWVWCKFLKAKPLDNDWVLGYYFEEETEDERLNNLRFINHFIYVPDYFLSNQSPKSIFEWIIPAYWNKEYFKEKLGL